MSHLILTEVNIHLCREEEARKHAKEVQRIDIGFSLEELRKSAFYKDPTHLESRLDVLRKAGTELSLFHICYGYLRFFKTFILPICWRYRYFYHLSFISDKF